MDRRTFLKSAGLLAVMPPRVPSRRKILVNVQLLGGNDGLNTVIPYADPDYRRCRPAIGIPLPSMIPLTDELALHPAMQDAARLFQENRLAIVQNVGGIVGDRSHIRNQFAWATGTLDVEGKSSGVGWLARAVGTQHYCNTMGLGPRECHLPISGTRTAFVDEAGVWRDANTVHGQLNDVGLGIRTRLDLIADLITRGSHACVYSTAQEGYDTHVEQGASHAELLSDLWKGISSFQQAMDEAGKSNDVLMLVYSEFGRSIWENRSRGTDHGTGGPVFLVGNSIVGGVFGQAPNLSLDFPHEPEPTTSFMEVQAAILEDWLNVPAQSVVAGQIDKIRAIA